MNRYINRYFTILASLKDLPPLMFRLILAYGFYEPAMQKIANIGAVAKWFGTMGIPFPLLNAYLAAGTEAVGIVLLTLGLGVRFIAVPLIVVMLVAISTVHLQHGFSCGHNGIEIPLYFMVMLVTLLTYGAGRFSIDRLVHNRSAIAAQ